MQDILLFFTVSLGFYEGLNLVSGKYFILSHRTLFKEEGSLLHCQRTLTFKKQNEVR